MVKKYLLKKSYSIFFVVLLTISLVPYVSSTNIIQQSNIETLNPAIGVSWWTMFRNDSTNVGFSESNAPDTENLLWEYQTDHYITSSPAVLHGKVYIGSWDQKLYCFDMMNGDMLWNYSTDGQITASPAVNNGRVYIGSQDFIFYCLDADDGSFIWKFETDNKIESSSLLNKGKIYFGSSDGSLYCLDSDSGNLIWEYPTDSIILSSPSLSNNNLYFGTQRGDFYCLNSNNGDVIWNYSIVGRIDSSPAIFDGKVYFGSNNSFIYCLDADDGSFIWSYDTDGEVHSSPAIAYGYVYIGVSGLGIFCLDAETGELVWKYFINSGVWSPPSVADDKVYYGPDICCSGSSFIHCVDAFTGEKIWRYDTGGDRGIKSSPAIAAGKVFIGTGNGKVMAFGGYELIADAYGPYNGFLYSPIQFTGAAYGGTPGYTWYWDFGDGTNSEEQNPIHIYNTTGEYKVTLTVTDDVDSVSIDLTQAIIKMPNNKPPNSPIIKGPTHGTIGIEYEWSFNSTDPDDNDVYYLVQWGDYCGSQEYVGPYPSGEEVFLNHTYNQKGTYSIYTKAYDIFDAESDWSILEITMPRNKVQFKSIILLLLEKFPFIKQLLGI